MLLHRPLTVLLPQHTLLQFTAQLPTLLTILSNLPIIRTQLTTPLVTLEVILATTMTPWPVITIQWPATTTCTVTVPLTPMMSQSITVYSLKIWDTVCTETIRPQLSPNSQVHTVTDNRGLREKHGTKMHLPRAGLMVVCHIPILQYLLRCRLRIILPILRIIRPILHIISPILHIIRPILRIIRPILRIIRPILRIIRPILRIIHLILHIIRPIHTQSNRPWATTWLMVSTSAEFLTATHSRIQSTHIGSKEDLWLVNNELKHFWRSFKSFLLLCYGLNIFIISSE